jgi:hypothetical protein
MKKRPELMPDWVRRLAKNWRNRKQRYTLWVMDDIGLGYLPVPKVASSGIRDLFRTRMIPVLLGDQAASTGEVKREVEKRIRLSLDRRALADRCKGLHTFTFVRNPFTRLYSCYRDKVVNAADRREKCKLAPYGIHFGMDFEDFVRCVADIPDREADQHFRSQHSFVCCDDRIMADYVGKIERFEEDWRPLEARFGLSCPQRSKRVSGTVIEAPLLPMNRAVAEIAACRYSRDISLFGYADEVEAVLARLTRT